MRICIIGGGNIGTAMAVIAAQRDDVEVVMLTSTPEKWSLQLSMKNQDTGEILKSKLSFVTSSFEQAVDGCDMIFIAYPSFMVAETLKKLQSCLKKTVMIGFIPGSGGVEFAAKALIQAGHVLFGVDRVPFISRVVRYGKSVQTYPKKSVRLCAIPGKRTSEICSAFSALFEVECIAVKNYLTITMTPSNPILHTSRLFALCGGSVRKQWVEPPLFYLDWDNDSSELLLACDSELQQICKSLSAIPLEVIPLSLHYESNTAQQLTEKMRSITSLQKIKSPTKKVNDMYEFDLSSRYFIEDFPYGLCVLKGLAEACALQTPYIDMILRWYEQLAGVQYFDGNLFVGKDLKNTGIAQNYGLATKDDIVQFYMHFAQME